jgi:hypothetical protein
MATDALVRAGSFALSRDKLRTPRLFGPLVDALALGGLSLIIYPVFLWSGYNTQSHVLMLLVLSGSFVCNYPHYAATYFKAYRSPDEVRRYFGVCVLVPAVLLVLGAASIVAPVAVAPWFCKAYLVTSGYHYSGQTYGIALIYANKAGMPHRGWQKWFLMSPIYMAYLIFLSQKEVVTASPEPFFTMQLEPLGFPTAVASAIVFLFAVSLVLYLVLNLYWSVRHGRLYPLIVHVVVLSHVVWFVFGSRNAAFYYVVPFFHCLQYLLITTFFYLKKSRSNAGDFAAPSMFASGGFLRYYVGLVVVGAVLFQVPPVVLSWSGLADFYLASAVVMSFLNLHHFLLDGAIWKLRKPDVGKVLIQPVTAG